MRGAPRGDPLRGTPIEDATDLSLVRGDLAWRLQRRLGLIPAHGMGSPRRALFFAAFTWLPLATSAWWAREHGFVAPEPLLAHYGAHVRCLVAIPLMILAEGVAHRVLPQIIAYLEVSGLVRRVDRQDFHVLLTGVVRLRDRLLPWMLILGAVLAWSTTAILQGNFNDVDWKPGAAAPAGPVSLAQWWYAVAARPIFFALLLAWLWRTLLLFILLRRLSRFPLCIVPAHPDRRGGLGVIERLALIFTPVALAISSVAAASFAHDVVYHGVNVMDIRFELAGTAILVALLFLAPFLPLSWMLFKVKRAAMIDYGALLAWHGRLVYRRWIRGERIKDEPVLDAPEIGPSADIQTLYQAVAAMRVRIIDKLGAAAIGVPAVLPVGCVALIQIPVSDIVGRVVKALM